MIADESYWVRLYDEAGAEYDEAQPLDVLRKQAAARFVADVESGAVTPPQLDLEQHALDQFNRHVMPIRNRRANRLQTDLEYILDNAFSEDGAYVDPLLDQVHRLGDGTNKPLRLWTVDEIHDWAYRRLAEAADVSEAAARAHRTAERLIGRMHDGGVGRIGDMFG